MTEDRRLGDTVDMRFTTRAFATGLPTQLAGTPAVAAQANGDTTDITAGITLGVDHGGRGGLNLISVVATAANGYETGKSYDVVITAGTVAGVSVVGEVVGRFTIGFAARAVLPQRNQPYPDIPFLMVQSSDPLLPATGLTVTAERSIDGGQTWVAATGAVTEAAAGFYHFDASAADMDGALITFRFTATGAAATFATLRTAA